MILITGGMGFIGLHTARALRDRGVPVVITKYRTDRMPDFLRDDPDVAVEPLDVTDIDAWLRLGDRYRIDGIVHLAAQLGSGDAVAAAQSAAAALFNVVEAAQAWSVKRITLASTIGIYAGVGDTPFRESALLPVESAHFIPAVKKTWEIMAAHLAERTGIETAALRLAGFWGPLKRSRNAMPSLLAHAAARGGPLDFSELVFDDPAADSGYDMIYVEDGARAIATVQLADALEHRTYNVGTGRVTRNRELLAAVREVVPSFELELPTARREPPPDSMHLDTTRLRPLGWSPQCNVTEGMRRYLAWLAAGHEW